MDSRPNLYCHMTRLNDIAKADLRPAEQLSMATVMSTTRLTKTFSGNNISKGLEIGRFALRKEVNVILRGSE